MVQIESDNPETSVTHYAADLIRQRDQLLATDKLPEDGQILLNSINVKLVELIPALLDEIKTLQDSESDIYSAYVSSIRRFREG